MPFPDKPPLPADFGTVVPELGSSCASCRYLVDKAGVPHCDNQQFITFRSPGRIGGAERIPAPDNDPARYCCNAWQPANGVKLSARLLDLGTGDVHVPGAVGKTKPTRTPSLMADITTEQLKKLPASKFADPAARAYPIHDKAHADNAAARLEEQKGSMSSGKYARTKARIKAAQRKFGGKPEKTASAASLRLPKKGLRMSVTHPDGTHVEVRHMAAYSAKDDVLLLGAFPLDKASALADGDNKKRVWVQVGKAGMWRGHPQGAFQLNAQIFDAIVRNFKTQTAGRIHYDFDHCSELRPTDGSRPMVGCPAQGWIYDLKHDGNALYALTEWGDIARSYIQEDKYSGVSPSIHWKTKDRVTGQDIGPQLTSVALTNDPFLHMNGEYDRLAASASVVSGARFADDFVMLSESVSTFAGAYAYAPHEYMPRIKSSLRLSDGVNPIEAGEHFSRFRSRFDAADGDLSALHDGAPLSDYLMSIRDMVQPSLGTPTDDMLDVVEELIEHAIEEHEELYHPDGPPGASAASASIETNEEHIMATATDTDKDHATLLATAQGEVQNLSATIKVKDGEIEALKSANATLATWRAEREEKDAQAAVTAVIETYKDKNKQCVEENRASLLSMYKHDAAGFATLFPPVAPAQRHLLRTFTNDGRQPTQAGTAPRVPADLPANIEELPEMTLMSLTAKIASERGIAFHAAQFEAERIFNKARSANGSTAR